MPRTARLLSNVMFDDPRMRKESMLSDGSTKTAETAKMVDIIHNANMDGVRHLKGEEAWARTFWAIIITIFVILAIIQILLQIRQYIVNPVATNIEAEYPPTLIFPAVAICNSNNFRLSSVIKKTFLHGTQVDRIFDHALKRVRNYSVWKQLNRWAPDASSTILNCRWPNGTKCSWRNFKRVWTIDGGCFAINTNLFNPMTVSGSGPSHGLKLLLNIGSYDRIESCSEKFGSKNLPGVKVLIYNQTDVPESSLHGVNVPPGFSMDITFKMHHRDKLPLSSTCIDESEEEKRAMNNFSHPLNIRTCVLRKYLSAIERNCSCSFRRMFDEKKGGKDEDDHHKECTVEQYFSCVLPVISTVKEGGSTSGCLPPCTSIDFTAWQDMNVLPRNIMPPVIDDGEEEDETDVEDLSDDNNSTLDDVNVCSGVNKYLSDFQVRSIKHQAHRAFEMQSRTEQTMRSRTTRMVNRLTNARDRLEELQWGWKKETLLTPFHRLNNLTCFALLSGDDSPLKAFRNDKQTEEERTRDVFSLVAEHEFNHSPDRFKTIGALKERYGSDADKSLKSYNEAIDLTSRMLAIFDESAYTASVPSNMTRMDRIFELMEQYEETKLERRTWAEKMQSRQMKHFFDDEFMEKWANPIQRDLDNVLLKTIYDLEAQSFTVLADNSTNRNVMKAGARVYMGTGRDEDVDMFTVMVDDMRDCILNHVKGHALQMSDEFSKGKREVQFSYNNLFKNELPDFLERYEFGDKFERENFALVNIFFHKMHLERWRQYETYSFWSLACDVGGALGLFVGASLLTLIEVVYLSFKYGLCSRKKKMKDAIIWVRQASMKRQRPQPEEEKERERREEKDDVGEEAEEDGEEGEEEEDPFVSPLLEKHTDV